MGSRIHISLQALLFSEQIQVELHSRNLNEGEADAATLVVHEAVVSFWPHGAGGPEHYTFDYSCQAGVVTLSRDFNFFRDPNEHGRLLRQLYEHSVSFIVHH